MTKSHGPDLRRAVIDLARCESCRGRGLVRGVFHEMDCFACNASGWVRADSLEPLPLQELVTQLNFKLLATERLLAEARQPRHAVGAAADYYRNNRRGAGGTNYTGD
ncbi:hypothetical protein [Pseudomonas urethralis]|uniref:hypothetical protein n=1 Tax=Pseudomonas urethralis TaxID=2740517 RepID=UPI0015965E03|nr:hypothetical protein [Pseudomonas urethralis]